MLKKYTLSFLKRWHLLFGTGFTVETIYGCKWLIDWTNSVDKNLSVKRHEDDQIVFMLDKIKELKPEIFIDIGAHGGLYSILVKKNFPNITVYSFEPDKQNRFQFHANLFLNNLEDSITIHDIGLSNASGKASFGIREKSRRGGKGINSEGSEKIKINKLDNVFNFEKKICFIKNDVEGHEREVLEGSEKLLKNNFCFIQTEILHKDDKARIFQTLNKFNYNYVFKIDTSNAPDYYFSNIS
ncbi:MAG: hypothetical protein CMP38_01335 [Rickettsiales bacterium]|nr:hypothetical protein [Rickettsiales bacterium]OUW05498.1 MAG: hypothetical protein CBD16_00955 [Betaproteobacteria bacterium TMED156]